MSDTNLRTQRLTTGAVTALGVVLGLLAVLSYATDGSVGRKPMLVVGTAEVLSPTQLTMDPTPGTDVPGGTGIYDVTGVPWTANGVTNDATTTPSCLVPGARIRVQLAIVAISAGDKAGPRWAVSRLDCLS